MLLIGLSVWLLQKMRSGFFNSQYNIEEYFTNKAAAEGFTEQNIKMVTKNANEEEKHRWYVEEVLEEEPDWIETDKVKTEAVKGGN